MSISEARSRNRSFTTPGNILLADASKTRSPAGNSLVPPQQNAPRPSFSDSQSRTSGNPSSTSSSSDEPDVFKPFKNTFSVL
jgi:hypothetical protein